MAFLLEFGLKKKDKRGRDCQSCPVPLHNFITTKNYLSKYLNRIRRDNLEKRGSASYSWTHKGDDIDFEKI